MPGATVGSDDQVVILIPAGPGAIELGPVTNGAVGENQGVMDHEPPTATQPARSPDAVSGRSPVAPRCRSTQAATDAATS